MTIRWANVPVPEAHIAALIGAAILHRVKPVQLLHKRWLRHTLGWAVLVPGIALAGWTVTEIGDMAIEAPTQLISTGPYAFSRNPMYIAWTLINIGIGFLANTAWVLVCLPAVMIATHRVILREEQQLEQQFGAGYRRYTMHVRRYV